MRAVGLALAVVLLSPLNPLVVVAVPVAVLLVAFRPGDYRAVALAALLVGLTFLRPGAGEQALWFAERGWVLLVAGGFVLAAALDVGRSLLLRGLAGLATGAAGIAVTGLFRPEVVGRVDWSISSRIRDAAVTASRWMGSMESGGGLRSDLGAALFEWAGIQEAVYPALLALATLAALGVAWYVVGRFSGVREALPPLRDFRFADQLVWVLVAGLGLMLLPVEGAATTRVGGNAVLFMGALYLVRGCGVLIWLATATVGSGWALALWSAAAILLYPVAAGAALLLGLSDTWIDVRDRLAGASGAGPARP